jgi:hypothetical protein
MAMEIARITRRIGVENPSKREGGRSSSMRLA